MTLIWNYITAMLPYMISAIPIWGTVRFIILKKQRNKRNWYHEIGLFLFFLYFIGLASQTILPKFGSDQPIGFHFSEINVIPFRIFYDSYIETIQNHHINYFIINFLGNIGVFIPLGFALPFLWKQMSLKQVIFYGFISSLTIEIIQLFISRGTDIDDLILNTIGALMGFYIYQWINQKKKYSKFQIDAVRKREEFMKKELQVLFLLH